MVLSGWMGPPSTPPAVRKRVGRYVVHEAFASGGMATLHFGRMTGDRAFARTVAIKRLREELAADPAFVAMLLDEAHLVSRIRHPNVAPVLDLVSTDGEVFLVLEYVHGVSLATLLHQTLQQGRKVEPRIVAAVVGGILHGLHAAHEATDERGHPLGIVHRDVSPQNILVGVDGIARLVDFGIAKAAQRLQATQAGRLKGKLPYMSPEQLSDRPVSRTTDVYAAAVCSWEALTGEPLFHHDSEGAVVAAVLRPNVPPPSTRALQVPAALDAVVMRALDVDSARRYSTAREMALHLEACVPAATQAEIGAWVEHCAHEALAARAACIAEIERREPSPAASRQRQRPATRGGTPVPPQGSRWRTIAGVGAASATLVAAALFGVHAVRVPASTAVAAAPTAAMVQSAAVPTTAPPVTQPALVTQEPARTVSRPARHLVHSTPQMPAARAKRDGACDLGYVMDDKGHKIYQAQCFH